MAKAKKPTDEQAMLIAKAGLMVKDWLVLRESQTMMCLVHRTDGHIRQIKI